MIKKMKRIIEKLIMAIVIAAMVFTLSACSSASPMPNEAPASPEQESPPAPASGGSDDYGYAPAPEAAEAPAAMSPAGGYYDDSYDPTYNYSGGEQYLEITENGEQIAKKNPEATFSLKVDTASYSNVKRYIEYGELPPADAVRTEELINWFSYDEPLKFEKGSPFAFYTEVGPSPFSEGKLLGMVRVGTREIDKASLPPSNLVFLIDVSGSMESYDKLPLLKEAFSMLTENLDGNDVVSIVVYASGTGVVLSGARGSDSNKINAAISNLRAGGSTAGAGGIQLAYELAEEYYVDGGNNRVILATDGDFNVGIQSIDELSGFISEKRGSGVYLSVLGFGTGNIREDIMETLAKDGNGNYNYIDDIRTAEKVLVDELASNLFTVAADVKAQIVFNPEEVYSYRLIGYENRMLKKKDFDDDTKDAGEIGAGSDVIALFEFTPTDGIFAVSKSRNLFDVRIRYKDPGDSKSKLIEFPVGGESMPRYNTSDFGFVSAVAMFGEFLRGQADAGYEVVYDIIDLAEGNLGEDEFGYREDFLDLLDELYWIA